MKSFAKLSQLSLVAAGLLFSSVNAKPAESGESAKPDPQIAKVKQSLAKLSIFANSISQSPIDGYYQVFTDRGLFYVSKDGNKLLQGKLYGIEDGVTDLTEQAYAKVRKAAIVDIADSALVYPAKDEKYAISVFTDITCGYCRKMHSEIEQFNEMGITVKYYAYPRGGLNSQSSHDLDVIWCNKDPEAAMTLAKRTREVSGEACDASPVTEHFKLGSSMGVSSTPALILEDGALVPGYKPPADLLAFLQSRQPAQ